MFLTAKCIRGDIAPASLKGRRRRRLDHHLPAHPGRYRPGLIEAEREMTMTIEQMGIRGDIAPASIDVTVFLTGLRYGRLFDIHIGQDGRDKAANFLNFLLASGRDHVARDGLRREQR